MNLKRILARVDKESSITVHNGTNIPTLNATPTESTSFQHTAHYYCVNLDEAAKAGELGICDIETDPHLEISDGSNQYKKIMRTSDKTLTGINHYTVSQVQKFIEDAEGTVINHILAGCKKSDLYSDIATSNY